MVLYMTHQKHVTLFIIVHGKIKNLYRFISEDSLNRTIISQYFTSALKVELTKVKSVYIITMSKYKPSSDRKIKPKLLQYNLKEQQV